MPFSALTFTQIVLISIFGVIAWIACGVLFCVVIPGLSPLRGTEAYLILSGIGPQPAVRAVEHGRRLGRAPRLGRVAPGRDDRASPCTG